MAAVDEFKRAGLLGHGGDDLSYAMADEIDGGRAGEIKILLALSVPEIGALAADCGRKRLAKGTPQQSGARRILRYCLTRHVWDYPVY